jgi:hypothetical protein
MCKHTWIITLFISLLVICGVAGCGTGHTDRLPLPDLITVALPYVEAVHFPAKIHAGQPFSITLNMSCDMNPTALRSPELPLPALDHWIGEASASIKPYRDLSQPSSSLPVQASVTYNFDPLPAGACTLYYLSATSKEQGGMNVTYDRRNQVVTGVDENTYYKTLQFTVLP